MASLIAGQPRYEAVQEIKQAVRHLRAAEDIARLELRDDIFADRVREVYEIVNSDVLNGRRGWRGSTRRRARAFDLLALGFYRRRGVLRRRGYGA